MSTVSLGQGLLTPTTPPNRLVQTKVVRLEWLNVANVPSHHNMDCLLKMLRQQGTESKGTGNVDIAYFWVVSMLSAGLVSPTNVDMESAVKATLEAAHTAGWIDQAARWCDGENGSDLVVEYRDAKFGDLFYKLFAATEAGKRMYVDGGNAFVDTFHENPNAACLAASIVDNDVLRPTE